MTLHDIAEANKMSLEEFFGVAWKWKTGDRFPPSATIREDVRMLSARGDIPLYVSHYLGQFTAAQTCN